MHVTMTGRLFAWDCMGDSPSLQTVREIVRALPDGELLAALRAWRGKGQNKYPVEVLWGTVVLTVVLRHVTVEACLGELRRNEGLRRLIGIESEEQVPKAWNISRFAVVLGREPHLGLLETMFGEMARRLGEVVPDLGRDVAGDSTGLSARRTRSKEERSGELPEPDGGRKEYADEEGKVVRVLEWFGYKLHLLVDVKHEVALSYRVTAATGADNKELPEIVSRAKANLPKGRMRTLAYDKAADDEAVHAFLDGEGIRGVIQNRSLWKSEFERMLPGHDGRSNVVYDEAGTVYCYDKTSDPPVRHRMAYIGYEPARRTIKYRCPARHERWACPSCERCNTGLAYGKTVRVPCDIDLRRFPAIPRATKKFERLYKGRTAVERVNGRLKVFWGADDGNLVGPERFHAWVGTVMVVHLAFATILAAAPRREGTLGKLRLSPIAKALRDRMAL